MTKREGSRRSVQLSLANGADVTPLLPGRDWQLVSSLSSMCLGDRLSGRSTMSAGGSRSRTLSDHESRRGEPVEAEDFEMDR
jgi:hypothetical protein